VYRGLPAGRPSPCARKNKHEGLPAEMLSKGCTGCGICAIVCPEVAITVYREVKAKEQKITNPQEKE
jgi:ferredoxin